MKSGGAQPFLSEVLSIGAASAGAVSWRRSGKLHVSAIVKATFAFAPSGVMTPTLPVAFRTAEIPHGEDRESSIRESLDTAPELRCADVLFAGHACAPALAPAPRVAVRLALRAASGEVLVDKLLEVLGDRLFIPGRAPPVPAPFTRIPMIYERAYGGPDHGANPVGMGQLAELAGRRRLPNVVHRGKPLRPAVEPAGFAPISLHWPVRRRMLRATPRHVLELPIAEMPDDLDPSYFQAAPADQRTRFLEGNEWIVLEGLHPTRATLETQLPGARGVARVYLPGGSSQTITLVADTLFIDGDAEQCSITWRGSFPIPSEADLRLIGIAAGVELPDRPVPLPDRFPRAPGHAITSGPLLPTGRPQTLFVEGGPSVDPLLLMAAGPHTAGMPLDGTMVLPNEDDEPPPSSGSGRHTTTVIAPPDPQPPPRAGRQSTSVIELPGPPPAPRTGRQSTSVIELPGPPPAPRAGRQATAVIELPDPPPPRPGRQATAVIELPDPPPPRVGRQATAVYELPDPPPPPRPGRQATAVIELPDPPPPPVGRQATSVIELPDPPPPPRPRRQATEVITLPDVPPLPPPAPPPPPPRRLLPTITELLQNFFKKP